jgi:hypothetical protein
MRGSLASVVQLALLLHLRLLLSLTIWASMAFSASATIFFSREVVGHGLELVLLELDLWTAS